MAKRPKKPSPFVRPAAEEAAKRLPSFVRNLDIPVGRATPAPGSMLKKPKKARDER